MKPSSLAEEKEGLTYSLRSASAYFKFRVRCVPFYYGHNCSQFCQPKSDSTGHYTCDVVGTKRCLPGWTGIDCTSKI